MNRNEFLTTAQTFDYFDVNQEKRSIDLDEGMLAFTVCQVPIIYIKSTERKVIVFTRSGNEKEMKESEIDPHLSKSIFQREDKISKVHVLIN
jgi:hypothetical protein